MLLNFEGIAIGSKSAKGFITFSEWWKNGI